MEVNAERPSQERLSPDSIGLMQNGKVPELPPPKPSSQIWRTTNPEEDIEETS